MRSLALVCCLWLFACDSKPIPPVVLPSEGDVSDQFVLELLTEHVAIAQQAPEDASLRGRLGMVYEANGVWTLSARAYANAAALAPEIPEWAYHAALAFYNAGESEEADRRIEAVVTRFPRYAPGLYRRGVTLMRSGRAAAAQADFKLCTQLVPNFAEGWVSEAEAFVLLDEPGLALQRTEKALSIQPSCLRAHHVRGLALQALGRAVEAGKAFEQGADSTRSLVPDSLSKAIRQYATGVSVKVSYAYELMAAGRVREALKVIDDGLKRRPSDRVLRVSKGVAYRRMKQPQRAVEVLASLQEDEPDNLKCLTVLAGAYFDLKDLQNSFLAADRATRLAPENGRAHLLLGRALVGLDRMEEAGVTLEKAIDLDPEQATAYIHLAESLTARARYAEAEPMWKIAVERTPHYTPGWLELGLVQLRLLKVSEARQTLAELRALGIDSVSSRDAQQRLAKALFDLTGE